MKAFVALIVIAAAAAGGYIWLAKSKAKPAEGDGTAQVGIPGPAGAIPGPAGAGAGSAGPTAPGGQAGAQVPPVPAGPVVPAAVKADYDKAEALWKEAAAAGDAATSRSAPELNRLYSTVLKGLYNQPGVKTIEEQIVSTRLAPLGTALFFSKARYDDAVFAAHVVASGESPDKVAGKYGTSYQHINLMRGRDVNDGGVRLGETLKVVRLKDNGGSFLHADKSDFCVDVYLAGLFARRYDISIGAPETPTPVGITKVTDLVYNPTWKDPKTGNVYQPGDPLNILGGVWIALSPDGINETGIGLHGYTGEDQTLRRQASNGCLRLGNEAIKELSYLIATPRRSPTAVEIVE